MVILTLHRLNCRKAGLDFFSEFPLQEAFEPAAVEGYGFRAESTLTILGGILAVWVKSIFVLYNTRYPLYGLENRRARCRTKQNHTRYVGCRILVGVCMKYPS